MATMTKIRNPSPHSDQHFEVIDITKHLVSKKQIYIVDRAGFGNKIFDVICGTYLYNLYKGKCVVNCVLYKSQHERFNDPHIEEIFVKACNKINFMSPQVYQELIEQPTPVLFGEIGHYSSLADIPKYEKLGQNTKVLSMFNLTFSMYQSFDSVDRNIFEINDHLIRDKHEILMRMPHKKYSIIHIRYGDKLKLCAEATKETFLVYTPQYYADMIDALRRKEKNPRLPVYIVSDSNSVVEEFIIKKYFEHDPNVHIQKVYWLDAFYMISHASLIIMSCSTFCFAAAYFNKNSPDCFLLMDAKKNKYSLEEYALDSRWKISTDKKYILNYNKPLAVEMNRVNMIRRDKPLEQLQITQAHPIALPSKKQIYLRDRNDLGHKIFTLIQAVYFQKLYKKKCTINFVGYQVDTEYKKPPPVDKIFLKIKRLVQFPTPDDYEKLMPLLSTHAFREKCFAKLTDAPSFAELDQLNRFCHLYQLTYNIIDTFTKKEFKAFEINPRLVSSKIRKLSKQRFAVVYVYYGITLNYAITDDKDADLFIIYTPQYYIDMITYFLSLDGKMPIYVLTNSPKIVEKYILNSVKQNKTRVNMLNVSPVEEFYMMTHASYLVMSTMACNAAGLLNRNKAECHMVTPKSIVTPKNMVTPNWKISHSKKYILNYDKKLASELLSVCMSDPLNDCFDR